jgi:hypothetical protein
MAVVTKDGGTTFGDIVQIPPGIMSRSQTFAEWDLETSGS